MLSSEFCASLDKLSKFMDYECFIPRIVNLGIRPVSMIWSDWCIPINTDVPCVIVFQREKKRRRARGGGGKRRRGRKKKEEVKAVEEVREDERRKKRKRWRRGGSVLGRYMLASGSNDDVEWQWQWQWFMRRGQRREEGLHSGALIAILGFLINTK